MPTLVTTKHNPLSPEESTKQPTNKRQKINVAPTPVVYQTPRQRERKKPNYLSRQIPQPPRKRQRKKSPPKRIKQLTGQPASKRQKIEATLLETTTQEVLLPRGQKRLLEDIRPLTPTKHYDKKMNDAWKKLFVRKRKDRVFYNRIMKEAKERAKTSSRLFKKFKKRYGEELAYLIASSTKIKTEVPSYFIERGRTGRKTNRAKTIKYNHDDLKSYIVDFGNIGNTLMPVGITGGGENERVEYQKVGDTLSNEMLHLAYDLVTPNIRNIGIVLLVIHQYRTRKNIASADRRDMKKDPSSVKLGRDDLPEILQIIDQVMDRCLPIHPQTIRNIWATHSYGNKYIEGMIDDEEVLTYREAVRQEWMTEEKETNLDWLDLFHILLIMGLSQTEEDTKGIIRLNSFIVSGVWNYDGNCLGSSKYCRIGPLTFLRPLKTCSVLELLKCFQLGLGGGLGVTRAATLFDTAILMATVWRKKLPSSPYQLLRIFQISFKKARVSFNGFGITRGVGIDSHGKRTLNAILKQNISEKNLDIALKQLPQEIARNVNDNFGEVGQSLGKLPDGDHFEWLETFFRELRETDDRFVAINQRWLESYKFDVQLQPLKKKAVETKTKTKKTTAQAKKTTAVKNTKKVKKKQQKKVMKKTMVQKKKKKKKKKKKPKLYMLKQ